MNVFHVIGSEFTKPSSEEVSQDEINRLVGVWAFNGWELSMMRFRSPEDDHDVSLVIARDNGAVKCVAERSSLGVKELGLNRFGLEDIVRWVKN